jgi:hypothetical protein
MKGRLGVVVRTVSLNHHATGSKQPLRIYRGRLVLVYVYSSLDPTHVGASGTGSILFFLLIRKPGR